MKSKTELSVTLYTIAPFS